MSIDLAVHQASTNVGTRQPGENKEMSLIPAQIGSSAISARTASWDEALLQVAEDESGLERRPVPLHAMRLQGGRLVVGETTLLLGPNGFEQLFRPFKAPSDYVKSLTPELQAALFNFHLQDADGRGRMTDHNAVVLSRNGTFRGFDRNDLCRLPAADVLQAVRNGLDDDHANLEIQNLQLRDEAMQVDIVSPQLSDEVRVGDVLKYGLRVRHSLRNDFATTIESFAFRLVCSNGLIQRQCIGRHATARSRPRTRRLADNHGQAHQQLRDQIHRLSSDAWQRLSGMRKGIRVLQQRPFDMPSLERFLRQARMHSTRLIKLVEMAWKAEGADQTAFGFLNALTRVATHETELSVQQRRRLDLLAGIFAGQDVHLCPSCFSVMSA
jgi:hypothetical protein